MYLLAEVLVLERNPPLLLSNDHIKKAAFDALSEHLNAHFH